MIEHSFTIQGSITCFVLRSFERRCGQDYPKHPALLVCIVCRSWLHLVQPASIYLSKNCSLAFTSLFLPSQASLFLSFLQVRCFLRMFPITRLSFSGRSSASLPRRQELKWLGRWLSCICAPCCHHADH